jgi:16S rRNA G527 N7-methylase RsmG
LRLVIRELGLDAEALGTRYEDLEWGSSAMDAAVSRALGGHAALLSWARKHLRPGGRVLLWTSTKTLTELGEVPGWRVVSWPLPGLDTGRLAEFQPCFT